MSETQGSTSASQSDTVKLVYLLNFAGFVVGITTLIAVVIAYLKRDEADSVAASHFTYQIRTFWISILFVVVSMFLMMIAIGFILMLGWLIWAIVRNVKGFMLISEGKPIPEPETWLW
ncbi:MAG: hypothetical protein COA62_00720 [Rhodobiaceae bacterium]|nr:MAG: hypothetical protein COA62_00720 [Rhodobiaceae bacterium]